MDQGASCCAVVLQIEAEPVARNLILHVYAIRDLILGLEWKILLLVWATIMIDKTDWLKSGILRVLNKV